MMAEVQTETKNALWRREEQLRRWDISETNAAPSTPRNQGTTGTGGTRVRFHHGCVFLAACSSGDRDEVTELLMADGGGGREGGGTDINTTNVDGLTALHQACIDENLPMVKFLVEHGACINLSDNEGWTALHATASCGFVEIAKYLIDNGANLDAVNNDGELALDLAEGKEMEMLISEAMEKQGIDAEQARNEEEETMLRDANQWLNSKTFGDVPHPKTGATALHIAAAKGYIKVMKILLDAGADVNARDFDGWAPIHAAAHWGQEEACKILVENFCNMEAKNNAGQTALDVVDSDIEPVLEELKKKQEELIEQHKQISTKPDEYIRGAAPGRRRSSITRMSVDQKASLPLKNVEEERTQMDALRQPVVEEKDEERKGLEDSDASKEESESESETEKRNEINTQASQPWTRVNGSSQKISDLSSEIKDKKVNIEEEAAYPPESKGSSIQPSTSRSKNLADVAKPELDSVVLRKRESNYDRSQASSANISKESETKEKTVSETTKATGVVPPYVKAPISRATSAPVTSLTSSRIATVARQESGLESKPMLLTNRRIDGIPSLWRSSLRKTGSANTVNDGHSSDRESDKIQRSLSVSRVSSLRNSDDSAVQKRPLVGSSEETDQKNRFNELYNRYAALVTPNCTTDQRTSTRTSSTASSAASATSAGGISSSSLSSQLLYGGPSSAQLSRLQTGTARKATDTEPATGSGISKNLEPPETVASTQRRASDVSKRDDEKEIERKARAKKARETRRSTQGVSKEDLQKAEEALQAANAQRIVAEVAPEKSTVSKSEDRPHSAAASTAITTASSVRQSDDSPSSYRRSLRDLDSTTSTTQSGYSTRNVRGSLLLSSSGAVTASQPSSVVAAVTPSVSVTSSVTQVPSTSTVSSHRTQYRSKYLQEKEDEVEGRSGGGGEEEVRKTAATETAEDKKDEKEDPSQKSAAIRAKKKRDSRRSTGRITLDGLQGSDNQDDNKEQQEEKEIKSSSEVTTVISSASDIQPDLSSASINTRYSSTTTTKDMDYKKMYEEEHSLNEKLKKEMKELKQELTDSKSELERVKSSAITGSSRPPETSALERRMTFTEKRALERRISELEEELRNSETAKSELKADNQRLKDENGALIRVISKLSK